MKNGWTLIELLIVLLVLGILAFRIVPAFRHLLARNRLVADTHALVDAMQYARITAISRNVPVTFCAGSQTAGCSGKWGTDPWLTFVDYDHDGILDPDESTLAVTRIQGLNHNMCLQANGPFKKGMVFMPKGVAERLSGAFAAGRVRLCSRVSISPNTTDIIFSSGSRIRLEHHDFDGRCPGL